MSTTSPVEITVKDTVVFLGAGADGAHWIVERIGDLINGRQRALLRSGRSGRRRGAYLDELELWRPVRNEARDLKARLMTEMNQTRELLARAQIISEMVANQIVVIDEGALTVKMGRHQYMVEVTMFEITEERV